MYSVSERYRSHLDMRCNARYGGEMVRWSDGVFCVDDRMACKNGGGTVMSSSETRKPLSRIGREREKGVRKYLVCD